MKCLFENENAGFSMNKIKTMRKVDSESSANQRRFQKGSDIIVTSTFVTTILPKK